MDAEQKQLVSAAAKLRELAEHATKNVCPKWIEHAVRKASYDPCGEHCRTWSKHEDAPWIILTRPAIASPLADWLVEESYRTPVSTAALKVSAIIMVTDDLELWIEGLK